MKTLSPAWIMLVLCAFGCASRAVRPPTPARDLNVEAMLATPKPENEHYYVLVFGSQTTPRIPRYTHTWATVVKTTELPGSPPQVTEVHTISWLPATLEVRPLRFWVEKGSNLDVDTTLRTVLHNSEHVSLWGPYETWHGLYERFLTQTAFLESGVIGYQCTDDIGEAARTGMGCDCFHAISDVDPEFDRREYPLLFYGYRASQNIVRQISERPILIHPEQTHDWLIPALGLDHYPIVHRQYKGQAKEFSPEAVREELESGPTTRRRLLP
jgi:hypothetical protein